MRHLTTNLPLCSIIAEVGVNHDGSLDKALNLIEAAANAGADVVKFQTFIPENIATKSAPKAKYHLQNSSPTETQLEMLKALTLSG